MQLLDWIHRFVVYVGEPEGLQAVAQLITALASLLWPLVLILLLFAYRGEIGKILRRLRKARLLGQEVELTDELSESQRSVSVAVEQVQETHPDVDHLAPPANESVDLQGSLTGTATVNATLTTDNQETEILNVTAHSPKAGLLLLSSHIERRIRLLIKQTMGSPRLGVFSLRQATRVLVSEGRIPNSLAESVESFSHVRNRVVHGADATEDEVLRAICGEQDFLTVS